MDTGLQILSSKPKHIQLSEIIRTQIVSGKFKLGDRLQSDRMLAEKYDINARTVAAGLNALVREGLLERAPRRGTIVIRDFDAVQGKNVSNAVAMVMLSKGDVYSKISLEISKGLGLRKLYPVLINENVISDEYSVKNYLDGITGETLRPYGFLIDGDALFPFDYLMGKIDSFRNIVFVTKFRYKEKIASAKYALVDFAEAGRIAARHFIKMGHKNIVCLAMHQHKFCSEWEREWSSIQVPIMRGFADECRENNIKFSDDIFWSLLHGAPFEKTVGKLLDSKDCPTAIFSYYDFFIRSNIIPLLESKNIKPMKDIELIGFYNTHHAEECGFSSICIHEEKIAEAAVKLLTNETDEREILIKPELVVRGMVNGMVNGRRP